MKIKNGKEAHVNEHVLKKTHYSESVEKLKQFIKKIRTGDWKIAGSKDLKSKKLAKLKSLEISWDAQTMLSLSHQRPSGKTLNGRASRC